MMKMHNKYNKNDDKHRETEIQEYIKKKVVIDNPWLKDKKASEICPFVRIKQGQEIEGMRKLLICIETTTWNSPINYMN